MEKAVDVGQVMFQQRLGTEQIGAGFCAMGVMVSLQHCIRFLCWVRDRWLMDSPLRLDRFFHQFLQPLQSMLVTHLSWIEKINVHFHFVLNIEKIVIIYRDLTLLR